MSAGENEDPCARPAGMIYFYILLTYLLVQTEALCARARGG